MRDTLGWKDIHGLWEDLHPNYIIYKFKSEPYECYFWRASQPGHPYDYIDLGITGEDVPLLQERFSSRKTVRLKIKDEWDALYVLREIVG